MNLQASIDLNCVVVKESGEYCVKSEDRTKNLGCKPSKAGAKKRLQQVEYFKHLKGGGQGSGRKKGSSKKKWSQMTEEERREAARKDPRQMSLPLKAGGPGSGRHKTAQDFRKEMDKNSRKTKLPIDEKDKPLNRKSHKFLSSMGYNFVENEYIDNELHSIYKGNGRMAVGHVAVKQSGSYKAIK
jgi:hypothetical protein